jgi:hypothetical protein
MYKHSVRNSQETYYGPATKLNRLILLGKQSLFIVYTADYVKEGAHVLTSTL